MGRLRMVSMTACLATSDAPGPTDGRHARGTWTPQVVPGSGGRRYLADDHVAAAGHCVAEPATVAVTAATPPGGMRRPGRGPIRYAPVPGAPRRMTLAAWGPPRPAGA